MFEEEFLKPLRAYVCCIMAPVRRVLTVVDDGSEATVSW